VGGEAIKRVKVNAGQTRKEEGGEVMALFGKGKITENIPDNSGLVNVDIKITRKDRQERKVRITVVEQSTGKTVFKTDFSDKTSQSDYGTYVQAEEIVKLYCQRQDYIIADMFENMTDKPTVQTVEKRSR